MFFESVGKMVLTRLRPSVFYGILMIPLLGASLFLLFQYMDLVMEEESFWVSCKKAQKALERRSKKQAFLQQHLEFNPYFLDESIESLSFLEEEKKEVESLLSHPALTDKKALQARLSFLSEGNHLSFLEESIQNSLLVKETEEKQRSPIQLNETDLKRLLSRLEHVEIDHFLPEKNSPQIVVTNFRLTKKETPFKKEVLEIEMELLKREFLKNEK